MSNNAQTPELLQSQDEVIGPSRAPQRSYSWTHQGPLPLPHHETRRFSAFAHAPGQKPTENTFWKNSGKVPGSIKAVKTTPPRAFQQAQAPPTNPLHVTTDSHTTTDNHTTTSTINHATTSTDNHTTASIQSTQLESPSKQKQPTSPPKSQSSSKNNSPEHSPGLQRISTPSRSKSTSSIPGKVASSASSASNSNGFGEFVHHCMEWKSCGRVGETTKLDRFKKILAEPIVDMENLKKICWKGNFNTPFLLYSNHQSRNPRRGSQPVLEAFIGVSPRKRGQKGSYSSTKTARIL